MAPAEDPWSERAADLYEFFFDRDGAHRDAERLHGLIRERTRGARSLLDVACGTGWHLERLREWYEVEGVDRSPAMLRYAGGRLPDIALHEGDMRSFNLGRTFDVVSCLSSSIASMRSRQDLQRAVEAMGTHVRKGGLLLIEPWDFPANAPSDEPWVATKRAPDRVVTLMETTTLDGDVWVQETHWLDRKRPAPIEHRVEVQALGAFEKTDYLEALDDAGFGVEFDLVGLLGRGLFIGTRR